MEFSELIDQAKDQHRSLFQTKKPLILVGSATCGNSAGAQETANKMVEKLEENKIDYEMIDVGCIGLCYAEPIITIIKPGNPWIFYGEVTPSRGEELVESYLMNDDPTPQYSLGTYGEGTIEGITSLFELPVLKSQVRRILRNCGFIDPSNIHHYIAHNGYSGLRKVLESKPPEIIEKLKNSGLRGRGGAGFPTWLKWQLCRESEDETKYLICNADEGDPGAFMNRSLLESDPHSVLEGILIAGYTIGAKKAYLYCRAEYPLALKRVKHAIKQMNENNILGEKILGYNFDFEIEVKEGAGAFVCGEETALIASIEGKRGMPRTRPPFPTTSGLWGKPTVINNVETMANVALVMQEGEDEFSVYGTPESKGTKTFSLVGQVKNTGLIEVPLGTTLREVIFDTGGGIPEENKFKAVQIGGPSGGCLPEKFLDTIIDYDSLVGAGAIMGSGGLVVMDQNSCMVDVARYFLDFTQRESCGKCVPCRLGTRQMLDILKDITHGHGKDEDKELLLDLADAIKAASLCGLGQSAPNPILTTIRFFEDEYYAHIHDKTCDALNCKSLISYVISSENCTGCMVCLKSCPTSAITGQKKEPHIINIDKCIKCGTCYDYCKNKYDAIERRSPSLTAK
jgi:NADH-quinone oxidoreductase subunit F